MCRPLRLVSYGASKKVATQSLLLNHARADYSRVLSQTLQVHLLGLIKDGSPIQMMPKSKKSHVHHTFNVCLAIGQPLKGK
jgi:hypothetical protein